MTPQVLVVSHDPMLLQTRQLILGAYFQVYGASRIKEAEDLIAGRHFDLIVLCYTLSESECQDVFARVADQTPQPGILQLSAAGSGPSHCVSGQAVMIEAGPYDLLKKSTEMLGVDIKAKTDLVEA